MAKYIDANILVYAFTKGPKTDICRRILASSQEFVINSLSITEAFSVIERISKNREIAQTAIRQLYRSSTFTIAGVSEQLCFEALSKSKSINLSFGDLIHYLTALSHDCESIISFDKDFDKKGLLIKREEP